MEQTVITFQGDNKNLFTRKLVEKIEPKTTVVVPETHNAILVKDGQMLQTLSSGKYELAKFVDLKEEPEVSLEILFLSKTAKLKLMWGTAQKVLAYDPKLQENYQIGFSGDFEVQIGDPRKSYLYLVGVAQDLTTDGLQERLMSNVVSVVESVVLEYIEQNEVLFNQISLHKKQMSQKVLSKLSHKLMSEYGIAVFSFNLANIIIDDEDLKRMRGQLKQGETNSLHCEECGAKLSAGAKFCMDCGRKVGKDETRVCPQCEAENSNGAKFCSNCGSKLD